MTVSVSQVSWWHICRRCGQEYIHRNCLDPKRYCSARERNSSGICPLHIAEDMQKAGWIFRDELLQFGIRGKMCGNPQEVRGAMPRAITKWHQCYLCGYRYTYKACIRNPGTCRSGPRDTCALCADEAVLATDQYVYEDDLMQLVFEAKALEGLYG